MAPTESEILSNYLTVAAKLPTILTLEQFTSYFPKSQQANPQIRSLYRDLHHQRNATINRISENILNEEKRGQAMRRESARIRRQAAQENADVELDIERALYASNAMGSAAAVASDKASRHTLDSIIPELDGAAQDVEAELEALEAEEQRLRESIQQAVGALSDLRYGKLSNAQLPDEVIQGLQNLQEQCDAKR